MITYSAGFDFSSSDASFAVLRGNEVLFDRAIPLPPRNASELPSRMLELLNEFNLDFNDMESWSVGAGPGSFTGLRIAASFVTGLAFGKTVKTRCVSSASALAHTVSAPEQSVLALYDGRKNELLAYGLRVKDGFFEEDGFSTAIRRDADLTPLRKTYPCFAALETDRETIRKLCPAYFEITSFAERIYAATLALWRPGDFSRPLKDLTYLRPAVFVPPSIVRTDV